jgi:hypothetical protein
MGNLVECNKADHINITNTSAFDILKTKYPWCLFAIFAYGTQENKDKSYVDTIETKLNKLEFDESKFDNSYNSVLTETNKKPEFDTIYDVIKFNTTIDGLEILKKDPYRLAVIDHYRSGITTYKIIETTYAGYLKTINEKSVTSPDFEGFCRVIDSLMVTYGPLTLSDPFFLDSMDIRLYRALNYVYSTKKSASVGTIDLNEVIDEIKTTFCEAVSVIGQTTANSTPRDVSKVVTNIMYAEMNEADKIYYSTREAYSSNKSWVLLPTVTTVFSNINSNTSVTIRGRVIGNGGANVTTRGIAYATTYNPDINNKIVSSGSGTGEFYSTISGLSAGVNYYARAYATNNKGTAYGNIISFNTTTTSTADFLKAEKQELKVFPNPALKSTTFSFTAKPPGNYKLLIYALNGQAVFSTNISQPVSGEFRKTVNLSAIPDGIYTCILTNGVSKSECKLVIEH